MKVFAVHIYAAMAEGKNHAIITDRHVYIAGHLEECAVGLVMKSHIFIESRAFIVFAIVIYGETLLFFRLLQLPMR